MRPPSPTSSPEALEAAWRRLAEDSSSPVGAGPTGSPIAFDRPAASETWWPGLSPAVRGRTPLPGAPRAWRITARVEASSLETARARIERERDGGADALLVVLDALSRGVPGGRRGHHGVPVRTAEELASLWRDLGPDCALALSPGGQALPLLALSLEAMARAGIDRSGIEFDLHHDPVHTLMRLGTLPGTWDDAGRDLVELVQTFEEQLPRGRALAVTTLRPHQAGADAATEIAVALASAAEQLRIAEAAGVSAQRLSAQWSLQVAVDRHVFEQVAKLRALRWVFSKLMAACGVDGECAVPPIHARPSPRTLTRRDPWVNVLRAATQTFAAAIGGADFVETSPRDQHLGPSSHDAERLARNVALVLREESHLGWVADPAGGAHALERRTEALARRAWSEFREIESEGGLRQALKSGFLRRRLARQEAERERRIATRKDPIVGVSAFARADEERPRGACAMPAGAEPATPPLEDPPAQGQPRVEALRREAGRGVSLLDLAAAAGRHRPAETAMPPLKAGRDAAGFESLRARVEEAEAGRAEVFVLRLGPGTTHRAAQRFASEFFATAGLRTVPSPTAWETDERADLEAALGADGPPPSGVAFVADGPAVPAERRARAIEVLRRRGVRRVFALSRGEDDEVAEGCELLTPHTDILARLSPVVRELLEICWEVQR